MEAVMKRMAAARPDRSIGRLLRDPSGAAGVEFVLVAPLLLGLLLGGVTLFDMYRYAERTEATTYTVADILSREDLVDKQSLADLHATHLALLGGQAEKARTRMSSVVRKVTKKDKKGNPIKIELVAQWTYDSDDVNECKPATDLPLDMVPDIALNDSVVIVETNSVKHLFTDKLNGIQKGAFEEMAIVRPRYVNAIGLKDCK